MVRLRDNHHRTLIGMPHESTAGYAAQLRQIFIARATVNQQQPAAGADKLQERGLRFQREPRTLIVRAKVISFCHDHERNLFHQRGRPFFALRDELEFQPRVRQRVQPAPDGFRRMPLIIAKRHDLHLPVVSVRNVFPSLVSARLN